MILKFNEFSVNELVKNVKSVEFHAEKLKSEIGGILPNIDFRVSRQDVHYVIEISKLAETEVSPVMNLLSKMRLKLSQEDLLVSYSRNDSCPAGDDIQIIVYIKNVHTIRVKPGRYVYHFTDKKNVDSILKRGLFPKSSITSSDWNMKSLEYPPAIFAVNDSKTLWGSGSILRIDTVGLSNKWWQDLNFAEKTAAIMTFEPIPANHITLISHSDRKSDVVVSSGGDEGDILAKAKGIVLSGDVDELDLFLGGLSGGDLGKVCGHISLVAASRGKDWVLDYLEDKYSDLVDWAKVNQWKKVSGKK